MSVIDEFKKRYKMSSEEEEEEKTASSPIEEFKKKYNLTTTDEADKLGSYDPSKRSTNKTAQRIQEALPRLGTTEGMEGYKKYLEDAKSEGANTAPSWLEQIARGFITASDNPVNMAVNNVTYDYRNDDSYKRPSDDWSVEQQSKFGELYLANPEVAFDYAEKTNAENNQRKEEAALELIQMDAASSVEAGITHTVGSIGGALFGTADYLNDLAMTNAGRKIVSDGFVSPFEYSQAVKEGISEHLNEEGGTLDESIPIIGGKGWGDVYGLGSSIIQSIASAYTLGGAGTLISYFGQGAAAGVDEALERGASDNQAVLYGTAVGVAEGLAEKVGVDNLFKLGASSTVKEFIKNILKQAGAEGLEEGFTSILSNIADNAIMQDKSNFYAMVDMYTRQGMSEEEAKKKAWMESFEGIAFDTLAGAASGGVSGSFHSGVQTAVSNHNASQLYGNHSQQLIDEALSIQNNSEVHKLAEKYQERVNKGKNLTGGQINRLIEVSDTAKLKTSILKRLGELGETSDVTAIADILVRQAMGEKLSSKDINILNNSKSGHIVAAEMDADNIKSGGLGNKWAESIGTRRVNPEVYSKSVYDLATQQTAMREAVEKGSVAKTLAEAESSVEGEYKVSENGKTIYTADGKSEDVEVKKIVSTEGGKIMVELDNGKTVDVKELSLASGEEGVMYEMVVRMGVSPNTANVIMNAFKPTSSKQALHYLSSIPLAYGYGRIGNEAGLKHINLSKEAKQLIYERGRADAQAEVESQQTVSKKDKVKATETEGKKIIFEGFEYNEESANDIQKASMPGIEFINQYSSLEVHVFESQEVVEDGKTKRVANIDGKRVSAPNGFFRNGNQIWIDINAGNMGEGAMLYTMSHEITHYIRKWNAKGFKVLGDFLIEQYGKHGVPVNALIEVQKKKIKNRLTKENKPIPNDAKLFDMAYEEMVSDAMSEMLADPKAYEKLAKLKQKNRTVWQKLGEAIKSLLDKLKSLIGVYKKYTPDAVEAHYVSKFAPDVYEKLQDLYIKAFVEADNNYSSAEQTLVESGIAVNPDTDSASLLSVRDVLSDDQRKKVSSALATRFGVTRKEAMEWLKAETSMASLILNPKYSQYLDYTPDPNEVAIKQNSDYPQGTVDFSPICAKRREFTSVMNNILRLFPNHVFAATDLAKIRSIMQEEGMTIPCGICYVEDRRQLDTIVAQNFIDSLKLYREGSKTRPDGKTFNANQLKGLSLIDGDSYTPSIYELVSLEGLNVLKEKNPNMAEAWVKFNNARGMQSVRLLANEAEYKRQILKYTKQTVKAKNDKGGLRVYSFSDAEMFHLIDIIQVIADSATVGLSLQGYTKVNEYARAVKDTGEKLNRSLIPKGELGYHIENGEVVLDYDTVEGIDINHPDFLDNKDNPNVGNITIGVSDVQIRAAMVSDFVDQIIPFHTGQSEEVLGEKGISTWSNYKDFQTEKNIATGKVSDHQINIYTEVLQVLEKEGKPINKRTFVEKFLQVCKDNGLTPRFSQFLNTNENGEYVYTEGYHKMLVDFKTFAQTEVGEYLPQMPVKPIFDNEYITKIMKDYVKSQKIKDAELTKSMPKVIERITNEIVNPSETKFSDRDSEGNTLSKAQQEFFKDSKARDEDGNLLVLYHGTSIENRITEFLTTEGQRTGLWMSTDHATAATFSTKDAKLFTKENSGEDIGGQGVYLLYANVKKPLIVDAQGKRYWQIPRPSVMGKGDAVSGEEINAFALENGYDGVIINDVIEGSGRLGTDVIVYSHNQVKYADNLNPTKGNDISYSNRDTATFNGKPFWSGSVSLLDGVIEEVHSIAEAEAVDFHHSMYFSEAQVEKMENGENAFFWVDNGVVQGNWRDTVPQHIINRIKEQIVIKDNFSYKNLSASDYYTNSKIYSYDFLTAQKAMVKVELPKTGALADRKGEIDDNKVLSEGIKNALSEGIERDGKVYVKNAYTGRELRIDNSTIKHGLDGTYNRHLTNARIGSVIGSVVKNAIPINGLKNTSAKAIGTYAMVSYCHDSMKRQFIAVVTVEQHTGNVDSFELYDVAHAVSGRQKKGSQVDTKSPGVYPSEATTISIAHLLEIVNSTHQSILSDDVLAHFGETRNPKGSYSDKVLFSDRTSYAPTFYSHMGKVVDGIRLDKMGANGVVSYLKGKGVKDEEIKWSGIETFLEGKKSVTKAELQEFIVGSQLVIEEEMSGYNKEAYDELEALWVKHAGVSLSETFSDDFDLPLTEDNMADVFDDMERDGYDVPSIEDQRHMLELARKAGNEGRWARYKLGGGTNYRELVFKMPNSTYSNNAMRAHWGDEAEGVLAHARIQDMTTDYGKNMLFIEEIQSDWHNAGHKYGYEGEDTTASNSAKDYKTMQTMLRLLRMKGFMEGNEAQVEEEIASLDVYAQAMKTREMSIERTHFGGDPSEPLVYVWWCDGDACVVEEDAVEFKTSLQNELLDLRDNDLIDFAHAEIAPDAPFRDTYHEYVLKRLLRMASEEGYDSIGWTTADIQSKRWSDEYAEGYRIEYDQDIPKFLRKYGKKWGATVGTATLNDTEVWSMDITDSMTDSVLYEGQVMYSERVTDKNLLDFLEKQEHITTYKSFVEIDGKLYSPMAAKVKGDDGKYHLTNPSEIGVWQQAVEDPKNIARFNKNGVGYYVLKKDNGKGVTAAYNPYEHSSNLVLNDQFEEAYQRPNLVTVECIIPKSEMTSGYKAKYAKDSTGYLDWKSGTVAGKLKGNKRKVYLSRWLKPVRILSDAEVATMYKDILGTKISVPFNVVTPQLLAELEKVGVKIDYEGSPGYQYRQSKKTADDDTKLSDRDPNSVSNRSLLANALESIAQNDIEKNKLAQYKNKIALIESEQAELAKIREEANTLRFTKGRTPDETKRMRDLDAEATRSANRISTYDKQLLNLESTTALKNVLEREKAKLRKRLEQKGKDALRKQKEKDAATVRELMNRHQESRHKAVESRNKTEMRHKIKNVVSDLNKLLLNPTKEQHVPVGLQLPVAEALDAINMDTMNAGERVAYYNDLIAKAKDPNEIAMLTKKRDFFEYRDANFKERITALKNAYAEFKVSDDPLVRNAHNDAIADLIKNTADAVGNTSLKDMSLGQLEAVYDMYKALLATVKNTNKMFKEGRQATITENSEAVKTEVKEVGGHHDRINKLTKGVKAFKWNLLKPIYALKTIGSDTLTRLYENVRAGEDTYAVDVSEARAFFQDKSKKYSYDSWDFKKQYNFKDGAGNSFSLSLEQIMSLYAYSKREQADRHLEVGGFVFDDAIEVIEKSKIGIPMKYEVNDATPYRLRKEDLATVITSLTAEQKGFIDEMQSYLSEVMGAKGNEVSLAMYDIKLYKEKHYFPLKTSRYFREYNPEQSGNPMLRNSGFSKKTVPQAGNPIVLSNFMDVWTGHVNDMSMYHSFVLPLEDFMRVYNYSSVAGGYDSVQQYIKNAYGAEANQYIEKLMQDINGGVMSGNIQNGWLKMFSKFKKATVAASLSTIAQQPTAVIRAMGYIAPKYFVGIPFKGGHKGTWNEIKQCAPIAIIKEMGGFDVGSGRQAKDYIAPQKGIFSKIDDAFMLGATKADEFGWNIIWKAVKREVASKQKLKPGTDEFFKACGQRFTEVVTQTQVYDSVFSRSGLMRDKGDLNKFATSFMGEPTTSFNMIYGAVIDAKRGGSIVKAAGQIASVYASIIGAAVLASLVYALRDDDEDESYAEKYAEALGNKLSSEVWIHNMIPYIRDLASIIEGWDVERPDMSIFADIKSSFDKLYKINEDGEFEWKVDFSDPKSVYSAVENFGGSIASAFGVPLKNLMRDTRAIFNGFEVLTDDIQPNAENVGDAFVSGWTGEERDKSDKIYEAFVNGDDSRIEVYKRGYKTEDSFETAVRKALRENDSRIKEAAQARYGGDISEYTRIAREIIAEGNFSQDTVVGAINSEITAIKKGESTETEETEKEDEATSIYQASDISAALENGDTALAQEIISDLVKIKVANGKTVKEAKSSLRSSMTSYWKPLYKQAWKSGNSTEMARIRKILHSSGLYGTVGDVISSVRDWLKD